MDKQGPRSSAKDKAEFDTPQNMKTEATKAATRTGLLGTKPEKPPSRRRQNCIWDEYNEIKAFFAFIISPTVSNKTVKTDKIWRGNNPPKWIHSFANELAYVKLTIIEHVYGWYLRIAKQLIAPFFCLFFLLQQFIN